MKGVIETTQTSGIKTIIPIQDIKFIEELDNCIEVILFLKCKNKKVIRGSLYLTENFDSIKAKIEAAT